MPINEAAGYRRSNLTKAQRQEQEAAVRGPRTTNMITNEFAPEDIQRMRDIIAQHDAATGKGGVQEFDINKPPKQPYTHQDFPKMVYDHDARRHKIVRSKKEEEAALKSGYLLEPYPSTVPETEDLDESEPAEIARLDKIARKKKQPVQE